MFQAMFARRAVLLALVVCGLALTLAGPLRVYLTQQHEMSQLAAQERQKQEAIDVLRYQRARRDSNANEIIQARGMGYVFPGEIPVQVMLPSRGEAPSAQAAPERKKEGPWYGQIWNSIAVPAAP
ncbi:Septum formation initiator [Segniliparus rotundus DSM 44985]|uniref:Septum formation initiator n=1 Tax=Segniliparus rotundus (strain ATCC BAA-972 / CDC 1076 / CIP 108378 / DSM 44985 / JCM 13578) TaxID=640132 RepID=D6Z7N7_SEGRD|nr:septum formation initiator [Segniliparus rotundus]ADG97967.1 Septum formation initiator [Segniliparus rotundus DSM 44985]